MASFYQKIRQKMSILIDDQNKPLGGKWSYDEDNRKKIPKNIETPTQVRGTEAMRDINIQFFLSLYHILSIHGDKK